MWPQVIGNGLLMGCSYAGFSVALGLLNATSGFLQFSLGACFALSGFVAYALHLAGWPMGVAAVAGVFASGAMAAVLDYFVFRSVWRSGGGPLAGLLASFALFIAVTHALAMAFGNQTLVMKTTAGPTFSILGSRWSPTGLWIVFGNAFLVCLAWVFLNRTEVGTAVRAVACDRLAAKVVGVHTGRVLVGATLMSGIIAGIGGLLVSLDSDVQPGLATKAVLLGCAAVLLAPRRHVVAAAGTCLVLGLVAHLSTLVLPAAWMDIIVFGSLLLALLVRSGATNPTRLRSGNS